MYVHSDAVKSALETAVQIYICTNIYMYIYIHIDIHIHVYIYKHAYMYIYK